MMIFLGQLRSTSRSRFLKPRRQRREVAHARTSGAPTHWIVGFEGDTLAVHRVAARQAGEALLQDVRRDEAATLEAEPA